MFNLFKRKQKYVNVFMSIMYDDGDHITYEHGEFKVKWPIDNDELKQFAVELRNESKNKNFKNIAVTSIISGTYR